MQLFNCLLSKQRMTCKKVVNKVGCINEYGKLIKYWHSPQAEIENQEGTGRIIVIQARAVSECAPRF